MGSINASRTDDLLAICLAQLNAMPDGPKLIVGDLSGTTACFTTLTTMTVEQGWTDIGLDPTYMQRGDWPKHMPCQRRRERKLN